MGNEKRISASQRVELIFDENSLFYLGSKIGGNGGGVLTGYGTISGRLAYFFSQDYAVKGGIITSQNVEKICGIYDLAAENGAPIIGIYDSCGAGIRDGIQILSSYGKIISKAAKYSGVIPQISLVAGPATGMLSIAASISDFTIVTKSYGEMYINSPEKLTEKEETYIALDDYALASKLSLNGTAVITAEDDKEGAEYVKRAFSLIPSNNMEYSEESVVLTGKIAKDKEDLDKLVSSICDSELEINKEFESEIKTSLVKISGRTIGILGVGRTKEVSLNSNKLNKLTQMVKLCNSYNIPLISLVNSSGFSSDLEEEKKGLILSASRLAIALADSNVPKISIVTSKAIGAAFTLLCDKNLGFDLAYALEESEISLVEKGKLVALLYKEELKNGDNKEEKLNDLIKTQGKELSSSIKAAEVGLIDETLKLEEVYEVIAASLEMLASKRVIKYPKKHSSNFL